MQIRTADAGQVRVLQEWALREGWGAGRSDIEAFHAADPEGFLIAWDGERPVGSISAVRYDDTYSFLGYYIVDPSLRGRGLGHALLDAGLERVGPAASGLDGVLERLPTYTAIGFSAAHLITRYVGSAAILSDALAARAMLVSYVAPGDVDGIIDYDARHVPARRESFVRTWLAPDSPRTSYVVGRGHDIHGYATVRPMIGGGSCVGPLFADDESSALSLLAACAVTAMSSGVEIAIDIPEPHTAATALAESLGMAPRVAYMRMYRGGVRSLPLDRIWGSTTFDLG